MVVGLYGAGSQGIAQFFAGIVLLGGLRVGKYQLLIEHVEGVPHLFLAILVPNINHTGLRVPHVKHPDFGVELLTVDELKSVLLIGRPETNIIQPDGVEVAATNHEIGAFLNDELRIDFYYTALCTPR